MKNGRRKNLLRILCMLCALALAVGLLAACGGLKEPSEPETDAKQKETNRGGDNSGNATETETETETDKWGQIDYKEEIPKDLGYNGATVNILMRDKAANDPRRYEWFVDSIESGDTLSEAIWFRNQEIEEQLKVKLRFTLKSDDVSNGDSELNQTIAAAAMSGGDGVDLISHYHYYATSTSTMNYYKNVMHPDFTYLHLENSYWNQNFLRYATTQGTDGQDRLFVLQGDMNLSTYLTTFCMFFQKNLLADRCEMDAEDLYKLTLDGKWTIDELISLCRDVATLDGLDGDSDGDLYGFTSNWQSHAYDGFLAAFDIDLTQVDDKGNHSLLGVTAQQKLQKAAEKLASFYNTDDVYLFQYNSGDYVTPVTAFRQDRSVFCVAGMGDYQHLSEMAVGSWGLLPLPKYEESQAAYYAGVQDSHNTVAVMYSASKNYEMLSAVLELFAHKSYSNVRPQLFNRVIKGQSLQDSQSAKVFDLIMNSTRWDFSDIYPTAVQNVRNTLWRDRLKNAYNPNGGGTTPNVIGGIAENKDRMNQALADLDQWLDSHYN